MVQLYIRRLRLLCPSLVTMSALRASDAIPFTAPSGQWSPSAPVGLRPPCRRKRSPPTNANAKWDARSFQHTKVNDFTLFYLWLLLNYHIYSVPSWSQNYLKAWAITHMVNLHDLMIFYTYSP